MKQFLFLLLLAFTSHGIMAGVPYRILQSGAGQLTVEVEFPSMNMVPVQIHGDSYVKINMEGSTPLLFKGFPDIPHFSLPVLIPNQKEAACTVVQSDYYDIPGIHLAPSKGSLSRLVKPDDVPYTFDPVYSKDDFFPERVSWMNKPYILRDFRGQNAMICPVQYNPVTHVLRVYRSIKLRFDFNIGSQENTLPGETLPLKVCEDFNGIYANHFINYKTLGTRYSPVSEIGKLAVFCPGKFLNDIAPYVQWKEMKGIKTYLVNLDTLSGGVSSSTIANLAKYYYQQKQIAYLLLVGDDTDIPPMMTGVKGPSDNGYAYINNGDHYPEFTVGRMSGDSSADIQTQVNRTLAYEKNPDMSSSWMRTQIGIGSEEGTGDDMQYDYEHIHDIVDSNKNQYHYLTNVEMYDGINAQAGTDQPGFPNITMMKDAVNSGVSLINYCGHGSPTGLVTTGFGASEIYLLNNERKLPFVLTVGCQPGNYVGMTCFAESMQQAKNSSGATGSIAAFMSTIDQYWDEPMQAQDEFNALLRGARASNLKTRLAPMCMDACMSMADQYDVFSNPNGILGGSDMTDTWVFFGDPTLSLLTKDEGQLTIDFNVHIQKNSTTYLVHCPVNGATIGLYYQGNWLAASDANGGTAYFTFPPVGALDTVFITATKPNYRPAFGKALVVDWPNQVSSIHELPVQVYPNPAGNEVQIQGKGSIDQLALFDFSGRCVKQWGNLGTSARIDLRAVASGTYILKGSCAGSDFSVPLNHTP